MDQEGSLTSTGRRDKAILIAGPTASGKSAVALGLARRLGGTVINADSMQVYADLRILSARPEDRDLAQAPHCLFGHVDGREVYSVGRWLTEARDAIAAAWSASRVPVVVGGTGLYFKALTRGLSAIPAVPPLVRERVRAEAEGVPPAELHARLARLDPVTAAKLRPTDPQRIVRALEVFAASGRSLASFHHAREPAAIGPEHYRAFLIAPERPVLNARIDARFNRMMDDGALGEIAALAERRLDPALPVMRALGVPPLLAHHAGQLPLDQAIAQGKLQTRHYAKRQVTFARHQLPDFLPVAPDLAEATIAGLWGQGR